MARLKKPSANIKNARSFTTKRVSKNGRCQYVAKIMTRKNKGAAKSDICINGNASVSRYYRNLFNQETKDINNTIKALQKHVSK